ENKGIPMSRMGISSRLWRGSPACVSDPTRRQGSRLGTCGTIVALCVCGLVVDGFTTWGFAFPPAPGLQGESSSSAALAREKLTPAEARDLIQALRQLQAAVQDGEPGGIAAETVKVQRPSRSVTPPTLTSAELDRLVSRHLAKNDPKV